MSILAKRWTECHEEVTRDGAAEPCDLQPVVALRADLNNGGTASNAHTWYPVCAKHVRAPMVPLFEAFEWAAGLDTPEGQS